MKRIHTRILGPVLALLLALTLAPLSGFAQVPHDMAYQGRLTDAVGAPLAGLVDLKLRILDVPAAGTALYSEDHAGVVLDDNGAFTVRLGTGSLKVGTFDAALFSGLNRYLELVVDGETLAPRQPLGSVPYALVAESAVSLQSAPNLVNDVTDLKVQVGTLPAGSTIADQLSANAIDASLALAQSVAGASVNSAGYLELTLNNATVLNAGPVTPAASAWDTMLWAPTTSQGIWK